MFDPADLQAEMEVTARVRRAAAEALMEANSKLSAAQAAAAALQQQVEQAKQLEQVGAASRGGGLLGTREGGGITGGQRGLNRSVRNAAAGRCRATAPGGEGSSSPPLGPPLAHWRRYADQGDVSDTLRLVGSGGVG